MILDSDGVGTLIRATGEDGRVVLVYADGHVVIVTEQRGRIFTTQEGLVSAAVWQAWNAQSFWTPSTNWILHRRDWRGGPHRHNWRSSRRRFGPCRALPIG